MDEALEYNTVWWLSAFIIGCNWTHTDRPPFTELILEPRVMRTWSFGLWNFFFVLMFVLAKFFYDLAWNYYHLGILKYYALWTVFFVSILWLNTRRLKEQKYALHIHHYLVALIVLSFISLQTEFFTFAQGLFYGMFIEGGARWGYDPIWTPEPDPFCPIISRLDSQQKLRAESN